MRFHNISEAEWDLRCKICMLKSLKILSRHWVYRAKLRNFYVELYIVYNIHLAGSLLGTNAVFKHHCIYPPYQFQHIYINEEKQILEYSVWQHNSTANYGLQNYHKIKSAPLQNSFNKLNIMNFIKVGFVTGLLYYTALVLAGCTP